MIRILVVPHRRGHRDALRVLVRITLLGLVLVRVGLQGQRRLGGDHLEQERQPRAEPASHGGTQGPDRVGGNALDQRHLVATAADPGRCGRVSAHPELGLRLTRRRLAEELGYGSW